MAEILTRRAALSIGAATIGAATVAIAAIPRPAAALANGAMTIQAGALDSVLRDGQGRVVAIARSRFAGDQNPTLVLNPDFVARISAGLEAERRRQGGVTPMIVSRTCQSATASYNWAVAAFVAAGAFLLLNPVDPIAIGMFILAEGAVSTARTAVIDACGR